MWVAEGSEWLPPPCHPGISLSFHRFTNVYQNNGPTSKSALYSAWVRYHKGWVERTGLFHYFIHGNPEIPGKMICPSTEGLLPEVTRMQAFLTVRYRKSSFSAKRGLHARSLPILSVKGPVFSKHSFPLSSSLPVSLSFSVFLRKEFFVSRVKENKSPHRTASKLVLINGRLSQDRSVHGLDWSPGGFLKSEESPPSQGQVPTSLLM